MESTQFKVLAESTKSAMEQWQQELLTWTQSSREFIGDQAPIFAQEILKWGTVKSIILLVLSIAFIYIGVSLRKWRKGESYRKKLSEIRNDNGIFEVGVFLSTWGFLIIGSLMFVAKTFTLLKIYFAPKLYIIQWLIALANPCN